MRLLGLAMIFVGIVLGMWVGFWCAFVGGIMQFASAVRAPELVRLPLVLGVLRWMSAGLILCICAGALCGPGYTILMYRPKRSDVR